MAMRLPPNVVAAMRSELPAVAEQVVAAVVAEVPSYADPFRGRMGRNIENAVQVALGGFLDVASLATEPDTTTGTTTGTDTGTDTADTGVEDVREAAYALGRGEARSGRSMDALASAYRVGARVAWRDLSAVAAHGGLDAEDMARFAALVFAYIDELSDASVSGHADELATSGRVRQRRLERLVTKLLLGDPEDELSSAAERADWAPPRTLTAVLVPESRARAVRTLLDDRALQAAEDLPGLDPELVVLLVPDVDGRARSAMMHRLAGTTAVVGPARHWTQARASYLRALRAYTLDLPGEPVDTDTHLASIVVHADPDARADLRSRVLAPLAGVSPTAREKLTDTLRAWLLHHGRRDEIAAALYVHPQTVRYRMGQLRELYGDRLDEPQTVLDLTVALG